MKRLLLMLLIFLLPLSGKAQESTRENSTDLLAFALIEAPGAPTPESDTAPATAFQETIYVYNPDTDDLKKFGQGDSIRWSPGGRYLAMADTVNLDPTAGKYLGKMIGFSVYDFETGATHTHEYSDGDFLSWSPDETFLIASGSVSSGLNGSNVWVDFLNPDGSGTLPDGHLGFVDGIMGSRGGISALGWVGSGDSVQLLVHDIGISRDEYALIDPITHEQTVITGDLPLYNPISQGWGERGIAKASDNRYAAVTRFAQPWDVTPDFPTFLVIVDMHTGDSHEIGLPVAKGALIAQMAWRPCSREVYRPECEF